MWYFELKFLIMLDFFCNHSVDCKNDFRVTFGGEFSIKNVTERDPKVKITVHGLFTFRVAPGDVACGQLAAKRNAKTMFTIGQTVQKITKKHQEFQLEISHASRQNASRLRF